MDAHFAVSVLASTGISEIAPTPSIIDKSEISTSTVDTGNIEVPPTDYDEIENKIHKQRASEAPPKPAPISTPKPPDEWDLLESTPPPKFLDWEDDTNYYLHDDDWPFGTKKPQHLRKSIQQDPLDEIMAQVDIIEKTTQETIANLESLQDQMVQIASSTQRQLLSINPLIKKLEVSIETMNKKLDIVIDYIIPPAEKADTA